MVCSGIVYSNYVVFSVLELCGVGLRFMESIYVVWYFVLWSAM